MSTARKRKQRMLQLQVLSGEGVWRVATRRQRRRDASLRKGRERNSLRYDVSGRKIRLSAKPMSIPDIIGTAQWMLWKAGRDRRRHVEGQLRLLPSVSRPFKEKRKKRKVNTHRIRGETEPEERDGEEGSADVGGVKTLERREERSVSSCSLVAQHRPSAG